MDAARALRMAVSVASVGFALGVLSGAAYAEVANPFALPWLRFPTDADAADDPWAVRMDGATHRDGVFGSPNLAPGDVETARIGLSLRAPAPPLSRTELRVFTGHDPATPFDWALEVTEIRLGADSATARALVLDAGACGNRDGRLQVPELACGLRDLPPPPEEPKRVPFVLSVRYAPDDARSLAGATSDLTLAFRLLPPIPFSLEDGAAILP